MGKDNNKTINDDDNDNDDDNNYKQCEATNKVEK